jgi:hypothetical protein
MKTLKTPSGEGILVILLFAKLNLRLLFNVRNEIANYFKSLIARWFNPTVFSTCIATEILLQAR